MKSFKFAFLLSLLYSFPSLLAQHPVVVNLLNDLRLDSLTHFVKQLCGEKPVAVGSQSYLISSRQYQQPGNEIAFQFMKNEFSRFGYQVDSFTFNAQGKNLLAIKPGYKYPDKWFMLGAHYDNWPTTTIAPGADDNASGTSAVLEAGRIFGNYNFPYTIVFVLWDEEEPGLLGSKAYVPSITTSGNTLMGYINVDMLGWDGNNDAVADLNVRPVAHSYTLRDRAQQCNTTYNIQLTLHVVDPGNTSTDHAPFWDGGYSAIGIDEEYDNDFNPFWHTPSDSLAKFNLDFYQKCCKLAYATLAELALDTLNTVGLGDWNDASSFKIFPNPFLDELTVQTSLSEEPIEILIFYDYMGRRVLEKRVEVPSDKVSLKVITHTGIYFLKIATAKGFYLTKVIRQ